MKKRENITMIVLILFLTPAFNLSCQSYGTGKIPQISVEIAGNTVSNGSTFAFITSESEIGQAYFSTPIKITNLGDKELVIENISFIEGSNPQMKTDPEFSDTDFPINLKEVINQGNSYEFKITYKKIVEGDAVSGTLIIKSNDNDHKEFKIVFTPPGKRCILQVNPPNITFTNASSSKPETQEFTISNVGDNTCTISKIDFEKPTSEFTFIDLPSFPVKIDPPEIVGGECPIILTVRYKPTDESPDTNTVIIESNDPVDPKLKISLYSQFKPGKIEVSYEDQILGYINFTQVMTGSCTKSVKLHNSGEGPVTIFRPDVKPEEAKSAYIVKLFQTGGSQIASCAEWEGQEITSPSYSLGEQKSLDVVVTYMAPSGMGMNGTLFIKYQSPETGNISIPMYGGTPKGEIEVAPSTNNLNFNAKQGDPAKEKTAVIYNTGNGQLTIKDVLVEKDWLAEPDSYSLKNPWSGEVIIEPWNLIPLTVVLNTGNDDNEPNATLRITYVDPLSQSEQEYPVTIHGNKNIGETVLPTADAGKTSDYAEAKVGQTITLDGTKSSGGSGEIWENGYLWFLSSKPKGSKVTVNVEETSKYGFIPDIEGAYEIRLVIFTKDSFFSDESVVTINVSKG